MEASFGPAIAALAALILVAGPLAVGVTKVTDFIRNAGDREDTWPTWVWNVVPMVLGVALCVGWGINLLAAVVAAVPALSDQAGTQDTLGQVLTGVIIGAMAGFWHGKLDQWSAWAEAERMSGIPDIPPVGDDVYIEDVTPVEKVKGDGA
jgi:hypothetical protein